MFRPTGMLLVFMGMAGLALAQDATAAANEPAYKQKKVYDFKECHSYVNGRANLTLCSLEQKQWRDEHGNRIAQVNYVLNNTGEVQVCGITMEMDDVKHAKQFWPAWLNTTHMPDLLSPTQIVEIGSYVAWHDGYPNLALSPNFWECEDRQARTPAPTPIMDRDCNTVTKGDLAVELCVYRNVSLWVEGNGDRVVGVSADLRNTGRGYVCNLDIAVEGLETAVSVWPAWFPYKADPFSPGALVNVGANVRTQHGIPKMSIANFDVCQQAAPKRWLEEAEAGHHHPHHHHHHQHDAEERQLQQGGGWRDWFRRDENAGRQQEQQQQPAPAAPEHHDAPPAQHDAPHKAGGAPPRPSIEVGMPQVEDEEAHEQRLPSDQPCKRIEQNGAEVEVCILEYRTWKEEVNGRIVQLEGSVTNVGFTDICNLELWAEQVERAYATYPEWWPKNTEFSIAPSNEVRFGITIPFAEGFPQATVKSFDSCASISSMDSEDDEDTHVVSKKLRGHHH